GQAGGRPAFSPPEGSPDVREPMPAAAGAQAAGKRPGKVGPLAMRDLQRRHAESANEGPRATRDGELDHAGSDGRQPTRPSPSAQAAGENGANGSHAGAQAH